MWQVLMVQWLLHWMSLGRDLKILQIISHLLLLHCVSTLLTLMATNGTVCVCVCVCVCVVCSVHTLIIKGMSPFIGLDYSHQSSVQ